MQIFALWLHALITIFMALSITLTVIFNAICHCEVKISYGDA